MKDGFLDLSDVYEIEATHAEIDKCRLRWGDLLLTEGGDPDKLGRGTFWQDQLPECIHQNHIFRVRFDLHQLLSEFISFQMGSPYGKAYFLSYAKQTTGIATINQQVLAGFPLMLPPLPEQRRIAAILREQMAAVDRARAAAEAQLAAAKALPAAYLRAVFESDEAQEWERRPLGGMCQIIAPQVDPRVPEYGALPHINGENIESGTCRLLYVNTAAEDGVISGKYLFDERDVLYSKLRPYLRKVTVAEWRGVCSADMYPIKVDRAVLDPYFTSWVLLSDEFTKYADEESRRARMPKLNREQLFAWQSPTPALSDQQRIAVMLSEQMVGVERGRTALEEQLDAINQLPAALLQQAFNGEL